MPVVVAGDSAMAEPIRWRKPRNPPLPTNPEADPNNFRSKSTISSILLTSSPSNDNASKKKNSTSATFRGLGCTATSQVSVPAMIRTSADWEAKKVKKKRVKSKKSNSHSNSKSTSNCNSAAVVVNGNPLSQSSLSLALSSSSCVGVPDVWCGPGISLTTDAASVDCVISRRTTRGKVDGLDRTAIGQREQSSYNARQMVNPEDMPFLEDDAGLEMLRFRAHVSGSRRHHHSRNAFREGFSEIVMFQNNLLTGGGLDGLDNYRDMRLDVDNMSYEELLELGDKIGYVSTGLRENDMSRCLKTYKHAMANELSSHFGTEVERKCSICQEEYERGDETGKLNCGHFYHLGCIKQWLGQKNICPICKIAAVSQS